MPQRVFTRSLRDLELPLVDFPDWELIAQFTDLVRRYESESSKLKVRVRDERGEYTDPSLAEIKSEMTSRGLAPRQIAVSFDTWSRPEYTTVHVFLKPTSMDGRGTVTGSLESTDEATVDHLAARARDVVRQAARRSEEHRRGNRDQLVADRVRTEEARPLQTRRHLIHDPNPWVLAVGGGVVVAVIVGAWQAFF